jgi:hypothetical protein
MRFLSPVILALFLSGCLFESNDLYVRDTRFAAVAEFEHLIPASDRSMLLITGISGNIEVLGVPEATIVEINGERRVESESLRDAEQHLSDLVVHILEGPDRVEIETRQPSNSFGRNYIVDYYCVVPADWTVDVLNTNGNVTADSLLSVAIVVITNGNATFSDHVGDVEVEITNGNVIVNRLIGNLYGTVTNGNILADVVMPLAGYCDLLVTNGMIDLAVPSTTSAEFSASVTNGTISVANLAMSGLASSPTSLAGTIGDGNGTILLQTTNGAIVVTGY